MTVRTFACNNVRESLYIFSDSRL